MGTEAGIAAGLYQGANVEQGIGVLGPRFAPGFCLLGARKLEAFSPRVWCRQAVTPRWHGRSEPAPESCHLRVGLVRIWLLLYPSFATVSLIHTVFFLIL